MLKALLQDNDSWIACAFVDDQLVGYCTSLRFRADGLGEISWVTQLVVAESFRQARVATRLLYSMWQFSDCYAWGLTTANPYAVRALETATRRPCRARLIGTNGRKLLDLLAPRVSYIPNDLVERKGAVVPVVDTRFYVDHSPLPGMLKNASRGDRPWNLGELGEGEEWFACTFREQAAGAINHARLQDLLKGADEIWIQAYEGMTLDSGHRWHAHSADEISFIVDVTSTLPGTTVLDVGCGDGRHVRELQEAGYLAVGVDISNHLIGKARKLVPKAPLFVADARTELPDGEYDLILLLYDVLGSSASEVDDLAILRNAIRHLSPGGFLMAGVMNSTPTLARLDRSRCPSELPDFVAALENLRPSRTMESTGAVFDPELLLYFDDVYYRKEQFQSADWRLPAELVIRDGRYTSQRLGEVLRRAGLEVVWIRPVQAGRWAVEPPLEESDPRAKELLALARRGSQ